MRNKILCCLIAQSLFVLYSFTLNGQKNVEQLRSTYQEGEISLKKRIKISFIYNEKEDTYYAKVNHRYDKLYLNENNNNGLIQIPFNIYQEVNIEKARFFKLNEEGGKTLIENVKVRYADTKDYIIENIFYNDLKVKQFQCNLDVPENYVVSYSYNTIYKDLKFLSSFYFQQAYEAVDDIEITIENNPNVDVSIIEFNLGNAIHKTEDADYIKYKATKLLRFTQQTSSVNGSYYLPHIIVSVKSFKTPKRSLNVLKNTDDMYARYNGLIKSLTPDEAYIDKITKPLLSTGSDEEKIEAIFKWVQDNVQYVAFENGIAGFKPEDSKKVAKDKYGDCKGMANLLVNMLSSAGYEASHAWIGTRSNIYSYDLPSLAVDNHMICALNYQGKRYFLDATDKSASWDTPPPNIANKEVLVAEGDTYAIDKIESLNASENVITLTGQLDIQTKIPTLKLKVELSGYFMKRYLNFQKYMSGSNKDNVLYLIIKDYLDGVKIENISTGKILGDKVTFTVTGSYLNFAKNEASLTVFPFLNIIDHTYLDVEDAATYIEFPYSINVNIDIQGNTGVSKKLISEPVKIGTEDYYADYSFKKNGDDYSIQQKIFVNILNSPLDGHREWNEFIIKAKSLANYPIIYELGK